ncbi:hypothetical protein VPNG_08418 [Cytospora leucostoma]|uniref:WKF domain-containing protein n=1 Tax=Cytospora leucostoma TaxID=1230097 RepID=A0A423W629_9PEZI|nr:hypothetical protein VPNG_08418 [Cytospora leucostoma]
MSAVPAWKRLGLKLKGASSDGSPTTTTTPVAQPNANTYSAPAGRFAQQQPNSTNAQYGSTGFKRKQFPPSSSYPTSDNKRPRWDDSNKKSVSFSEDTKKPAPKKSKPKQKKAPKPQAVKQPHDLTPSLEYLRTWDKARDSWKFNKNHQTLLLKNLYNADAIPAQDIDTFYLYIRDIKGASRQRLIDEAEEIRKKDMADGSKAFPEGTKGTEEKQQQYDEVLASLLQSQADIKDSGDGANAKRSFDELSLVDRTKDKEVQNRLVKRLRAETVIKELQNSEDGESAATSAASGANASALPSRVKVPVTNGDAKADGKQKTKRRKKLRTADSDSSSSSDSDSSDSGSDSEDEAAKGAKQGSGSSSSSSSESDDEVEAQGQDNAEDESSSSSSSSDSESPKAGAAVSDDEDTSGSDGDSESSDDSDDEA